MKIKTTGRNKMRKLTLDGKVIQDNSECYVIAEIGTTIKASSKPPGKCFRLPRNAGRMR